MQQPTSHHLVTHADGTVQQLRRRLLNGKTAPVTTLGRTWQELVVPGGGRAPLNPDHPSRKHDVARPEVMVTPSSEVPGRQVGQPRRRERRALARHQQRHHEVSGSVGGSDYVSECACGRYFTAPSGDLLREVTDQHYERVA